MITRNTSASDSPSWDELQTDLQNTLKDIERFESQEARRAAARKRKLQMNRAYAARRRNVATKEEKKKQYLFNKAYRSKLKANGLPPNWKANAKEKIRRLAKRITAIPLDGKCPICGEPKACAQMWCKYGNVMICRLCKNKLVSGA